MAGQWLGNEPHPYHSLAADIVPMVFLKKFQGLCIRVHPRLEHVELPSGLSLYVDEAEDNGHRTTILNGIRREARAFEPR